VSAEEVAVEVAGEVLRLLPERAVYRPADGTLLIADPHFGKAAAFRAAGLGVPGGTTEGALARLDRALARTRARRLVVLGDFFHARAGRVPATLGALAAWRQRHPRLEVVLVRGNHDRQAGDPLPELGIQAVDPPRVDPPFALLHHPAAVPGCYALAGHLHPAVELRGRGRLRERLPCFWFGVEVAVLPAFGEFTGSAEVRPRPGEQVFVVAGEEVLRIPDAGG
jgi:uncharacterized protein